VGMVGEKSVRWKVVWRACRKVDCWRMCGFGFGFGLVLRVLVGGGSDGRSAGADGVGDMVVVWWWWY
jgi:hypothetical protein